MARESMARESMPMKLASAPRRALAWSPSGIRSASTINAG